MIRPSNKTKTAVSLVAVAALLAASMPRSYATIPVIDYTHILQSIQAQITNITQYVSTVTNTYRTAQQTAQQVMQFYNYLKMFGDPSKIAAMLGLSQEYNLFQGLRNTHTIQDAMGAMNGAASYSYTADGAFPALATLDQFGKAIQRDAQRYNPYTVIEKSFENYRRTAERVRANQNTLEQEYRTTLDQITNATSDAAVQKLSQKAAAIRALMAANQAQLANAGGQVTASSQMLAAEQAKQAQAAMEEHITERQTANAPIQMGSFSLNGGSTLPSGPAWVGQ